MSSTTEEASRHRVVGLDSIRFICALVVVFAHTGHPPLRQGIDTTHPVGWAVDAVLGVAWSSAAAVIVFFVISGFCIHYAHSLTLRIGFTPGYLARRYARIAIPMGVAILVSRLVGVRLDLFQETILWSLAAELIYYTLYPLLLWGRRRFGSWIPLILVSLVAALLVAATKPMAGSYPMFGLQLNWLLGLPCWLAGCQLADHVRHKGRAHATPLIWLARASIWGLSAVLVVARFHSPLGYPWTLNFFALIAAVWLAMEIAHFRGRPPPRWLEWMGVWSYSLYLTHKLASRLYDMGHLPTFGPVLDWALRLTFILLFGWVFYRLCEQPAHDLGRFLNRLLEKVIPAGAFRPRPEP